MSAIEPMLNELAAQAQNPVLQNFDYAAAWAIGACIRDVAMDRACRSPSKSPTAVHRAFSR